MVLSHHITLQWILIILLACSVKGIVHPRIKPLIHLLVLMFFQTKTFCSFKQTRLSELLIYVPWKRIVIVNNACKILHANIYLIKYTWIFLIILVNYNIFNICCYNAHYKNDKYWHMTLELYSKSVRNRWKMVIVTSSNLVSLLSDLYTIQCKI